MALLLFDFIWGNGVTSFFKSKVYWIQQRAPELLVILFLALLPLDEAKHLPVLVFLVVFIVRAFKRNIPISFHLKWYVISCLLLLLPMVFSLFVAVEKQELIQEIVRWSLYMLAGIALVLWFQERIYPAVLVYGIAAVLLFWSVDALIQYFVGRNILGFEYNSLRLTGVFHPNMRIGNMLAHWSPFLFEAFRRISMSSTSRFKHWIWLFVLPVFAVILLSGSRAAWLVMLVNVPIYVLYLIYRGALNWKVLVVSGLILITALAFVIGSSPEMKNRFEASLGFISFDVDQMNRASSNRIPIWLDGWDVFKKNPVLGIGKGNIHRELDQLDTHRGSSQGHMHLFGLDVLLFTGLVGFIFYACFLIVMFRFWWHHIRQGHHLAFASGLALVLMCMPINVHWGFYTLRSGSLMILFLAIAFGVYSHYALKRSETTPQTQP